jgi:hypothetical protein
MAPARRRFGMWRSLACHWRLIERADVSKDPSCVRRVRVSVMAARRRARRRKLRPVEIKPNAAKRPIAGAVHAAVYREDASENVRGARDAFLTFVSTALSSSHSRRVDD